MSGSEAEREMRGIFNGNEEKILNATKTAPDHVRETYLKLVETPFLSLRGAGSFGVDLIAIRGSLTLVLEVKSSKRPTIHFSNEERLSKQYEWILAKSELVRKPFFYGQRYNGHRGERWRLHLVPTDIGLEQFGWVPTVQETRTNHKIDWNNGLELSAFIEKLLMKVNYTAPSQGDFPQQKG